MKLNPTITAPKVGALVLALTLGLTGCSGGGASTGAGGTGSTSAHAQAKPSLEFNGPNKEKPGTLDQLTLTDDEIATVKKGGYTAAFVWHTSSEFVSAVEKGARQEFEKLGIEVVASTQADFDAAKQANNMQSVLALSPDIIVTIAVDPTSAASAFKEAVDKGAKLVIMTTPPAGYAAGKEFVSIVTESLTDAGRANAEILGDALDGQGDVGYLYHDADFWFTNQRDKAFKDWLAYEYPNMKIAAEEGFSDESRTEEIATAMITRNPNLKGIYVSWATAAQGVVSAIRNSGRTDIKVVTNDLDATLAADMMGDGVVLGMVGNGALGIGKGLAIAGAYGMLGKQAPALVASKPTKVTKDNLVEGWQGDYGTEPPASVTK